MRARQEGSYRKPDRVRFNDDNPNVADRSKADTGDPLVVGVPEAEAEAQSLATTSDPAVTESNKQTAEVAKQWLVESKADRGYRTLRPRERVRIVQAFAARNKVVYGQAFDLIRIPPRSEIDFDDLALVTGAVKEGAVVLVEVKAAKRARKGSHFKEHFFSISTAELLVAQSLGELYKFAFVNVDAKECYEVSLRQIYSRTKAIYPTWSIRLDDAEFPPGTEI